MMEKMKEIMENSIFEVFEKMFFISLEHSSVECSDYDMESSISFSGSISGEVKLLLSKKISTVMVQNLLTMKEDVIAEREIVDCSKEAVNMICGNFLAKLDDQTNISDLTIPVFAKPPEFTLFRHDNVTMLNFVSDDGEVGVVMRLWDGCAPG